MAADRLIAQESSINGLEVSKQQGRISSQMTIPEIIECLGVQGCQDLQTQLDEDTYDHHPIANGGFGDIYKAKLKSGTAVAIKTMRLFITSDETSRKGLKHVAHELYTWSKCDHPNVHRLLGLIEFRNQLGMVSTWATNGDLSGYIRKESAIDRHYLCFQIAEGLAYLHEKQIVHGDLKAANILVSDGGVPLLSDFGNATLGEYSVKFTSTTSRPAMSLRWASPELLEGSGLPSVPADIYALGMTILASYY